jgi:hypothetical protein
VDDLTACRKKSLVTELVTSGLRSLRKKSKAFVLGAPLRYAPACGSKELSVIGLFYAV